MARLVVGGTPDAVASSSTQETQVGGSGSTVRYALVRPRLAHSVWTTETGSTRLTDLLLDADGSPVDTVVADDIGQIPAVRLPDGLVVDGVWFDPDDTSTRRFFVPARTGPASIAATTVARPPVGTPAGTVPTLQADGTILYQTPPGTGSSAVTAVDF